MLIASGYYDSFDGLDLDLDVNFDVGILLKGHGVQGFDISSCGGHAKI